MNIAMEQTEEYVNGQLKNKYGDAFIRGNNGMYVMYISIKLQFACLFSVLIASRLGAVLYISTSKRSLTDGA
jgi:hypothetical protein